MEEKACKRCKIVKPLSEFYKAKGCKDGTRHECRKCLTELSCLSQSTRSEQRKEYMKEYKKANEAKWRKTPEQKAKRNAARNKKYAENEEYRDKIKDNVKSHSEKNPALKKRQRLRKYGMTINEFESILKSQDGKCAICGYSDLSKKNFFPMVDHCHDQGHVRGLLCGECNFGLSKFKDNIELLQNAIKYLQERGSNGKMDNMV